MAFKVCLTMNTLKKFGLLQNCTFLYMNNMYGIQFFLCRNTAAASIAIRKMAVSVIDSSDLRYTDKIESLTDLYLLI